MAASERLEMGTEPGKSVVSPTEKLGSSVRFALAVAHAAPKRERKAMVLKRRGYMSR